MIMTCQHCGGTFTATRSDARYCSDRCRKNPMTTALNPAHGADERRERYYELRRQGADMWSAGNAAGVSRRSAQRYERWFQATGSGQQAAEPKTTAAPAAAAPTKETPP